MTNRARQTLPVQDAYDRWAASYDTRPSPMVVTAGHALAALDLEPGCSVMELGCGTGRNLALLKARGAGDLYGLDLSAGMITKAREGLPKAVFIKGDFTAASALKPACIDLALFSLTLEHVAELEPALSAAHHVLKPGGRVVILEIHPDLSAQGVGAHFVQDDTEIHMPCYRHVQSDYETALEATGFQLSGHRDWRARDLPKDAPAKVFKRGLDQALVLQVDAVKQA